MNQHPGLIGKKLGNTQIFEADGNVTRVTVIEVGPCVVLGRRTVEKDGYSALILGFGEKSSKQVNKPEAGHFAKLGATALRAQAGVTAPAHGLTLVGMRLGRDATSRP